MPTGNMPRARTRNKLRPEDIEKIAFVFTQKIEIPKYSRLVDKSEIVDFNLNIRRYVDNTPAPDPEDVQAHLIGGVPEAEVNARQGDFAKFGISANTLFQPERAAIWPLSLLLRKRLLSRTPWKQTPLCKIR